MGTDPKVDHDDGQLSFDPDDPALRPGSSVSVFAMPTHTHSPNPEITFPTPGGSSAPGYDTVPHLDEKPIRRG